MQLADWELAQISTYLADAEAILAVLPQKLSQVTAELGLVVVRGALFALDEAAADARHAARALQKLRSTLATLNVPPQVHEHVSEAFRVLGRRQAEALRHMETACLCDARYRQQSLRAQLQGVRAELAGEDPAAALEPARRAQMIVDELGERLGPPQPSGRATATPEVQQANDGKSPREAVAELVQMLGG